MHVVNFGLSLVSIFVYARNETAVDFTNRVGLESSANVPDNSQLTHNVVTMLLKGRSLVRSDLTIRRLWHSVR